MKKRLGITPVISVVLLLTISVFASLTAYTFMQETQEGAADALERELEEENLEENSQINFEHFYEGPDGFTLIDVRNTGGVSLIAKDEGDTDFELYVDGAPVESETGQDFEFLGDFGDTHVLEPQERITINTTDEFPEEGEETMYMFTGPYELRDSYVCESAGQDWC